MTNKTWRILLHATDGQAVHYTLSSADWDGPVRRGHGIAVMSSCRPDELPSVLDSIADYVLHEEPFSAQPPLLWDA
jgi:hypothetical protein